MNSKIYRQYLSSSFRKLRKNSQFRSISSVELENRVVVTGLGIVCPLGIGVPFVWNSLLNGHSGVVSISSPEYKDIPCKIAAFIPLGEKKGELNLNNIFKPSDMKKYSMSTVCALIAAKEALNDSKWYPSTKTEQEYTGVAVGTGMVDLMDIVKTGNSLVEKGYSKLSPFFVPRILNNMSSGHIAINFGFKGPNHSVSTACATGLHAIGDAYNFIRNRQAKVMVCGSAEAVVSPLSVAGFARMRALATNFNDSPLKASRPFDKGRDGFVMGEGAGVMVLEDMTHALQRKAHIYSEVVGYGLSGDAYHITSPSEDGNGAFRSMHQALSMNKVNWTDVGYINAHATSTPLGDAIELKAIHDLFKDHAKCLMVSSTKGATGHLLGAAGSIEAIFSVLACQSKLIPPNLNLEHPDMTYPVKLAGKSLEPWPEKLRTKRVALTNSFGFGGTNASVVFQSVDILE